MTDSRPPVPNETRQRKLDDLFGDEPFLSPTMKARRLYEKVAAQPSAPVAPGATIFPSPRTSSLSGLVPEVSEDEASAYWQRRTDASRRPDPADDDVETPRRAGGLGIPALRLTVVDTTTTPERHATEIATVRPFRQGYVAESPEHATIPMASAAAYLRAACPSGAAPPGIERLQRFRTEVLLRWLKQVPTRGVDSAAEEF
jgi:hypothetical protein